MSWQIWDIGTTEKVLSKTTTIVIVALFIVMGITVSGCSSEKDAENEGSSNANAPQATETAQTSDTPKTNDIFQILETMQATSNEHTVYLRFANLELPAEVLDQMDIEKDIDKDEILAQLPKALHFKDDTPNVVEVEFDNRTETGKLIENDDGIAIELDSSGTKLQGRDRDGRYYLKYSEADNIELMFMEPEYPTELVQEPELVILKLEG